MRFETCNQEMNKNLLPWSEDGFVIVHRLWDIQSTRRYTRCKCRIRARTQRRHSVLEEKEVAIVNLRCLLTGLKIRSKQWLPDWRIVTSAGKTWEQTCRSLTCWFVTMSGSRRHSRRMLFITCRFSESMTCKRLVEKRLAVSTLALAPEVFDALLAEVPWVPVAPAAAPLLPLLPPTPPPPLTV